MITLILGHKGAGKTKKLIELVNTAIATTKGNVVCIEKENKLTTEVNYRARLISTDSYMVEGYDSFYGFLAGVCAGDHDITDILIDATLKIGGRDYDALGAFLKKVKKLSDDNDKNIVFTVSADKEELPEDIFEFCNVSE